MQTNKKNNVPTFSVKNLDKPFLCHEYETWRVSSGEPATFFGVFLFIFWRHEFLNVLASVSAVGHCCWFLHV